MGGPLSTSQKRTTTLVLVHFRYFSLSSLPDHMLNADILPNTNILNKTQLAHPHHGHTNDASMRE